MTRAEKDDLFRRAADLLDPVARRALAELDEALPAGSGTVAAARLVGSGGGGPHPRGPPPPPSGRGCRA